MSTALDPDPDRLPLADLEELLRQLREAGIEPAADLATIHERATRLRGLYEGYINAIAGWLDLPLPQWLAPESPTSNWRTTEWH